LKRRFVCDLDSNPALKQRQQDVALAVVLAVVRLLLRLADHPDVQELKFETVTLAQYSNRPDQQSAFGTQCVRELTLS